MAHASVALAGSIDDMTMTSDAIVLGTVEKSGPVVTGPLEAPRIQTLTTIRVINWVKGGNGSERVTIREEGGRIAKDIADIVTGTPEFSVGEEVLLFLRVRPTAIDHATGTLGSGPRKSSKPLSAPSKTEYQTFDMSRGKFRVLERNNPLRARVIRDDASLALATWTNEGIKIFEGGQEAAWQLAPFLDLLGRIQAQSRSASAGIKEIR
jgi:hypothetical protein